MKKYFDTHFQKDVVILYPGDYFSTFEENELISTVLGSCIAITLFDASAQIGGMNHFMLVSSSSDMDAEEKSGRFGEYAVELLLNDMIKKGAQKKRISAKVFGGSNIFNMPDSGSKVGAQNIFFAFDYLEREKIPVQASDVGGNYPRKIYFDPKTSKVWLKHIKKNTAKDDALRKREEEYRARIKEEEKKKTDIIWF